MLRSFFPPSQAWPLRGCAILAVAFMFWFQAAGVAFCQAVPELPRLDYYIARDLYDAGNIGGATEGFRTAINRSHQIGQQRWIDSVPPLVMLGDCYYQQGAIAQALEQYDAALMLALAYPTWADNVRGPEPQTISTSELKGINWTKTTRRTQLVQAPNVMLVPLDAAGKAPAPGNSAAAGAPLMRLDVPEVIRCLAIALQRRTQLLGPLGRYSPLSAPAVQQFSKPPQSSVAWLQASWRVLHGLALQTSGDDEQSKTLLEEGASVDGKADYFLTPLALLALAHIDARQGNATSALNRLGDASLRAAQLEQADVLSDCLAMIGQLASASRRGDLLPTLQSAVAWAEKNSTLAYLSGSAAVCELAAVTGSLPVHEASAKQMLVLLGGKDIVLPRVQAQLGYAMARAAAAQNRIGLAEQQLQTSLSMLRGSKETGAATPRVFQTQMALSLATKGVLPEAEADQALSALLAEPPSDQWLLWPLECLAAISSPLLPAYEKWLDLAHQRGSDADVIQRMDRMQRKRFHEMLPLGGRLLAARQALKTDQRLWSPEVAESMKPVLKMYPSAATLPQSLYKIIDGLSKEPLAVDDRSISPEAKKKFGEMTALAETEENLAMSIAMQRSIIPRHWPEPIDLSQLRHTLSDGDVVLSFVHTPTTIYGAAITQQTQHTWAVAESSKLDVKIALLLTQLGLRGAPDLNMSSRNVAWRATASELAQTLLPAEARQLVVSGQRLIIVPSGNLWYLPFDLLPAAENDVTTPLLARHRICYLPTLAHVRQIDGPPPTVTTAVGLYGNFFATDRELNQALASQVAQDSRQSVRLDVTQKLGLTSPSWLRIRADQLWVACELPAPKNPWELRLLPVEPSQENALANWMQAPMRSPARVFLPGLQTSAQRIELNGGDELFVPACTLMATGVRSLWVSRWKVGGRSSQIALSRVMEELAYESPSSAWQRTAIALWAEKLATADEPLLPEAKALPKTIDGSHPLLWSGYMMIGDHRQPQ